MNVSEELLDRVTTLARAVEREPRHAGVLSTGERCAVALLRNCADDLPRGYTFLDAVERLGADWLAACVEANRRGWKP
jgi:hypothetical protein